MIIKTIAAFCSAADVLYQKLGKLDSSDVRKELYRTVSSQDLSYVMRRAN